MKGYVDIYGITPKKLEIAIELAKKSKAKKVLAFLKEYKAIPPTKKPVADKKPKIVYNAADFKITGEKLTKYIGANKNVLVPNGVITISATAFKGCGDITSITIPQSVVVISDNAFEECANLTEINVSDENVIYLSQDGVLFSKNMDRLIRVPIAKNVEQYTIPDTVTAYAKNAFTNCTQLGMVVVPENVTSLSRNYWGASTKNIFFRATIVRSSKTMTYNSFDMIVANITSEAFSYVDNYDKVRYIKGFLLNQDAFQNIDNCIPGVYCVSHAKQMLPILFESDDVAVAKAFLEFVKEPENYYAIAFNAAKKVDAIQITAFLLDYRGKNLTEEALEKVERKNFNKSIEKSMKQKTKEMETMAQLDELTIDGLEEIVETDSCDVKVKFADGKSYKYYCNLKVNVGDRVLVSGTRAGQIGAILEITHDNSDWFASIGGYMEEVMKAYKVL